MCAWTMTSQIDDSHNEVLQCFNRKEICRIVKISVLSYPGAVTIVTLNCGILFSSVKLTFISIVCTSP